ncbi:MAG: hypothetical protein ACO4AM_07680 [Candidatus Nanopelagicaceae bacterium]
MFTYDLTGIKDYESFCLVGGEKEKRLSPLTSYIVYGMLIVEISDINASNITEVYARLKIAQKIWTKDQGKVEITVSDIIKHIGLRTNVPNNSRSEWLKTIKDYFKREIDWHECDAKRSILAPEPAMA